MPITATITSYYTFVAGTKARAAQVNSNFSLYRGHNVPIDPNTATAINNTYDLGSTEYYWRTGYVGLLNVNTISTSTIVTNSISATHINVGNLTVNTAGTINFLSSTTMTTSQIATGTLRVGITSMASGGIHSISSLYNCFYYSSPAANSITTLELNTTSLGKGQILGFFSESSSTGRYIAVSLGSGNTDYHYGNRQSSLYISQAGSTAIKIMGWDNTQWRTFTPTGNWSGANATYTGVWRKVGDSIDFVVNIALSGAFSGVTCTVDIPVSTLWTIDTAKLVNNNQVMSKAVMADGTTLYNGSAVYVSTTNFKVVVDNVSATYSTNTDCTNTVPFSFSTGDSVVVTIYGVPITNFNG